jgi:hypothetical protein
VLWVKDKKCKIQDSQDKETSTDEVQREYKRIQKQFPPGHGCLCFVLYSKGKRQKLGIRTKKYGYNTKREQEKKKVQTGA